MACMVYGLFTITLLYASINDQCDNFGIARFFVVVKTHLNILDDDFRFESGTPVPFKEWNNDNNNDKSEVCSNCRHSSAIF